MSIYGLTMNAHLDPDPYVACHHDITEHPHYHDCDTCRHAKYATCLYGRIRVRKLWFAANLGNFDAKVILQTMGISPDLPLAPEFCE